MTDTIPTLAHAVRIGSDLSLYRERERAERVISHAAGGVLVELVDRRDYERERQRRIAAEGALQMERSQHDADTRESQQPSMYVLRSTKDRPAPRAVKHPRYLDVGTGDLVRLGLDHLDPLYARPAPTATPERADGCPDSVACPKGGAA